MLNSFSIVIPVYNSEKWISRCIDSVLSQNYKNYELIIIDDHSTDMTWDIIKKYKVNALRNKKRIGSALANIVKGIKNTKNDIIITVDGDDSLANTEVLSYLNEVYQEDIWLTYGQYRPLSGKYKPPCSLLSKIRTPILVGTTEEIGNLMTVSENTRTYRRSGYWVTSHLRTFKRWLWDRIDDKDLREENGEYFKIAGDLAYMYPLIEMAGESHARFIEKILYIYNDLNPNGDGTVNPELQIKTGEYIQSKKIYNEL
jgi:glycosyltransferase involved in cell wall biosynthesis